MKKLQLAVSQRRSSVMPNSMLSAPPMNTSASSPKITSSPEVEIFSVAVIHTSADLLTVAPVLKLIPNSKLFSKPISSILPAPGVPVMICCLVPRSNSKPRLVFTEAEASNDQPVQTVEPFSMDALLPSPGGSRKIIIGSCGLVEVKFTKRGRLPKTTA